MQCKTLSKLKNIFYIIKVLLNELNPPCFFFFFRQKLEVTNGYNAQVKSALCKAMLASKFAGDLGQS